MSFHHDTLVTLPEMTMHSFGPQVWMFPIFHQYLLDSMLFRTVLVVSMFTVLWCSGFTNAMRRSLQGTSLWRHWMTEWFRLIRWFRLWLGLTITGAFLRTFQAMSYDSRGNILFFSLSEMIYIINWYPSISLVWSIQNQKWFFSALYRTALPINVVR